MPGAHDDKLRLIHQVEHDGLTGAMFTARTLERGDREVRRDAWATSARELPSLGEPIFRARADGGEAVLFELDDVLLQIHLYSGNVFLVAAAASSEPIDALLERLRGQLPAPDPSSAHEVTVTFWTYGPNGPMPSWRSIAVPSWDEIRDNYSSGTRTGLERLMTNWQPAHGGQLVLWHGLAGTGKTFGLRALAWEWKDWCDFHYIVDPDTFFGQHADYLMSVLLQPEYMGMGMMVPSAHGFIARASLGTGYVSSWDDESEGGADEDESLAGARAGGHGRTADRGRESCHRAGPVAVSQCRGRADRTGIACARAGHDERADPQAPPGGRSARTLCRKRRVCRTELRGGLRLARRSRGR